LQAVILVVRLQALQTQALACCDFQQSAVDNFIAIARGQNLQFAYPLYFTGDRRAQMD